ncbi:hypothetical protein [Bacillus safensis]|uniref:hypothetical protein n=1 Tax=Bacillus safensis TaxID=561879 RepID=UPI000DCEF998|nr:hypothetical protein [Bacillus safensis]RAU57432.1 hypothetical protein BSAJGB5T_10270 [Bacillus safensis]
MKKLLAVMLTLTMITLMFGSTSIVQAEENCPTCEKTDPLVAPTTKDLNKTIEILKDNNVNTLALDKERAAVVENDKDKAVIIAEKLGDSKDKIEYNQYFVDVNNEKFVTLKQKVEKLDDKTVKAEVINVESGAKYSVTIDKDGNKLDENFISGKSADFKQSSLCSAIVGAVLGTGSKLACIAACTAVTGGWGAVACGVLCAAVTGGISWAGAKNMCEQLFG